MSQSIFRALSDPNRRAILRLLTKKTMSAGEIASYFSLAKSTLSSHFNVLKNAGLIQEERNRTTVLYSINLSVVEEAIAAFMDLFGAGKPENSVNREEK